MLRKRTACPKEIQIRCTTLRIIPTDFMAPSFYCDTVPGVTSLGASKYVKSDQQTAPQVQLCCAATRKMKKRNDRPHYETVQRNTFHFTVKTARRTTCASAAPRQLGQPHAVAQGGGVYLVPVEFLIFPSTSLNVSERGGRPPVLISTCTCRGNLLGRHFDNRSERVHCWVHRRLQKSSRLLHSHALEQREHV